MAATWTWSGRACVAVLVVVALVGAYSVVVGWPATPMSTTRADWVFGRGVKPGQSQAEVKAWLASRGIFYSSTGYRDRPYYTTLRRREDVKVNKGWWMESLGGQEDVRFKGGWMGCRGGRTVAECAGLDAGAVHSVIRVSYPDAARPVIGWIEVVVYLFFGADGRLIRHWATHDHYAP